MKALLMFAVVFTVAGQAHSLECKFNVGKQDFQVKASTESELIDKAAKKCFNVQQELSMRESNQALQSNDKGYDIVDACTNVMDKCLNHHGG